MAVFHIFSTNAVSDEDLSNVVFSYHHIVKRAMGKLEAEAAMSESTPDWTILHLQIVSKWLLSTHISAQCLTALLTKLAGCGISG